ncbi:hypothetical protein BDC45DRAFT_606578 [Circinella umbellata]|nr:hypothetical protein BDC45DRAFT_606578 [Circinella umbellata]
MILGQSWIVGPSSGCFTASSVKFLKFWQARLGRFPRELLDFFGLATEYFGCPLSSEATSAIEIASVPTDSSKATRSAIEIASVPTDSTSGNNRFCPGAKLRVSTKASDFSVTSLCDFS